MFQTERETGKQQITHLAVKFESSPSPLIYLYELIYNHLPTLDFFLFAQSLRVGQNKSADDLKLKWKVLIKICKAPTINLLLNPKHLKLYIAVTRQRPPSQAVSLISWLTTINHIHDSRSPIPAACSKSINLSLGNIRTWNHHKGVALVDFISDGGALDDSLPYVYEQACKDYEKSAVKSSLRTQ